jgi:hypothetical protein
VPMLDLLTGKEIGGWPQARRKDKALESENTAVPTLLPGIRDGAQPHNST